MLDIVSKIKEIEMASGKAKEAILEKNKNDLLLQNVLMYTYNPSKKYGFSKSILTKGLKEELAQGSEMFSVGISSIFDLLDELNKNNINDDLRRLTFIFLKWFDWPPEVVDLYQKMILKDLRCGINAKTINKVFPNLIPVFNVMLAEKYEDKKDCLLGKEIIVTEKLDGYRCMAIIDGDCNVKLFSRNGKEYNGFDHIVKDILKLSITNYVLDGELILKNTSNISAVDNYNTTSSIISGGGSNKGDIVYHVFDGLPLDDFLRGKSSISASDRKQFINHIIQRKNLNVTAVPALYTGVYDENKISELHEIMIGSEKEGLMINVADGPYECKRTKNILKVKATYTVDLEIIGYEEGEGKYQGSLGALVVNYKGNNVGVSGMSDADREYIWNNRKYLIGKIVEVKHRGEIQDKNNVKSLRFPTFKALRPDKDDESYT